MNKLALIVSILVASMSYARADEKMDILGSRLGMSFDQWKSEVTTSGRHPDWKCYGAQGEPNNYVCLIGAKLAPNLSQFIKTYFTASTRVIYKVEYQFITRAPSDQILDRVKQDYSVQRFTPRLPGVNFSSPQGISGWLIDLGEADPMGRFDGSRLTPEDHRWMLTLSSHALLDQDAKAAHDSGPKGNPLPKF